MRCIQTEKYFIDRGCLCKRGEKPFLWNTSIETVLVIVEILTVVLAASRSF